MLDLWSRIQLAKINFYMGALNKTEYIAVLNRLYEEAL